MNFFKSVFADEEPDSPKSESKSSIDQLQSDPDPNSASIQQTPNPNPNIDSSSTDAGGVWSFGGLIKTLTTKSESVIEIYRRDLKEFGSGLKKELEVAHGSLENVGHTIDEIGSSVLKGTAQIISQGKEAILAADQESDSDNNNERGIASQQSLNSKPYSRFDAQVRAIQGDASTYCEEPEDLDDYEKWKPGFVLEEKREEVERLLEENGAMESIYKRVVPNSVDEGTFWCRYYYKIHKLKLAENVRANLVKRAISSEEEDLSWDVDDDEDDDIEEEGKKQAERSLSLKDNSNENEEVGGKSSKDEKDNEQSEKIVKNDEQTVNVKEEKISVEESKGEMASSSDEKVDTKNNKEETVSKSEEKSGLEGKGDHGESSKDSDVSVISSHPSLPEEEDLGWDEIEDLSSIDDKKVSRSGSPNTADLRKRLSAADEDEDLSWDIEDDDEPVKA